MEILQTLRKYFALVGITENASIRKQWIIGKRVIILITFSSSVTANTIFFFYEAENFEEYTNCIHSIFTMIVCGIEFLLLISKTEKLFDFIKHFEEIIKKSKSILTEHQFKKK